MRVLVVSTWYPSAASSVAGSFVRADARLLAQRHHVEVVHLAPPGVAEETRAGSDEDVVRIRMSTSSPRDILRAWRALRSRLPQFDVVHTHAFSTLLPFAGRRVGIPWVHTEHWSGIADPTRLSSGARAAVRMTGRVLNRPDLVIAVSDHLAQRVRRYRSREIRVIPPAVLPATVVAQPRRADDVRLVGVGGLVPGKDPLLAVEVVRELRRRGTPASMDWAGDGPLRAAVEERAGEWFRVRGEIDQADVGRLLDDADAFLLPTRGETLCLSALESIAHGRPVVLGARGGQQEYVTPANGRLVASRTPDDYADAVQSVLDERMPPDRVAGSIGERFHPATVLGEYERAYAHVCRARR